MPRIPIPLTAQGIKALKAQEKAYTKADGQGLQLLVKADGTKLWEYVYKSPTLNKRRKTSFGAFDSKHNTLVMARDKRS
ncbi:MAG: integrase arm-type DNA-binding domain-containing protein, partial [Campylobacterota bacterium]|nr:integrase arm-type DNA-binding domain-containing protein [Campylobacterota bacterium]